MRRGRKQNKNACPPPPLTIPSRRAVSLPPPLQHRHLFLRGQVRHRRRHPGPGRAQGGAGRAAVPVPVRNTKREREGRAGMVLAWVAGAFFFFAPPFLSHLALKKHNSPGTMTTRPPRRSRASGTARACPCASARNAIACCSSPRTTPSVVTSRPSQLKRFRPIAPLDRRP